VLTGSSEEIYKTIFRDSQIPGGYSNWESSRIESEASIFIAMAQQNVVGQGFLIIEVSRSQLVTPHSIGLLSIRSKQGPVRKRMASHSV